MKEKERRKRKKKSYLQLFSFISCPLGAVLGLHFLLLTVAVIPKERHPGPTKDGKEKKTFTQRLAFPLLHLSDCPDGKTLSTFPSFLSSFLPSVHQRWATIRKREPVCLGVVSIGGSDGRVGGYPKNTIRLLPPRPFDRLLMVRTRHAWPKDAWNR